MWLDLITLPLKEIVIDFRVVDTYKNNMLIFKIMIYNIKCTMYIAHDNWNTNTLSYKLHAIQTKLCVI